MDSKARIILDYWFGDLNVGHDYFDERNKLWFGGRKKTDEYIREHFEPSLKQALKGEFENWKATPKESLALIVLLDQFSLNLYREQPASYENSARVIPLAKEMVQKGWDWTLTPMERVFVYMPLEHSENILDQELSVTLFKGLATTTAAAFKENMDGYLDYAERHHRVVAKFGRFPDRNEVFGRADTPEEKVFLASDEAPF